MEEKAAIVPSILRGEFSISEPSRRHEVSCKTMFAWRDWILKGGEATRKGKGPDA